MLAASSPLWRRWTAGCYSVAVRGGEIHARDAVGVVAESENHGITVEEARKWRIPLPLSVEGTGKSGPYHIAKMRELAWAGAKA